MIITPRRTTLTTATGPRALHRAIAEASATDNVCLARATVILVPTRSAEAELRHTLENLWLIDAAGPRAVVFPDILTRSEFYRRLAACLPAGVRVLSDIEAEVRLGAAARAAMAAGNTPPFRMRPALVAEMRQFYDTLRRQQKSVADFERLVLDDLEPRAEFDRGADRLLRQTRFLVAACGLYEERLTAANAVDEHGLRGHLLDQADAQLDPGLRRVIVTTGDRVSDPGGGLYTADFDLLARIPRLESLDLVATRSALLAGLGERLRSLLPGIEEHDLADASDPAPALVTPPAGTGRLHFESRDREEELRDIARRIKASLRASAAPSPRTAVVFRRPLPYVYLGRTVFDAAKVEAQSSDALPLAAEPFAAALDLVFSTVASRFARRPLLQLLRSPHFLATAGEEGLSEEEVSALDRMLAEGGYLGDAVRLRAFADTASGPAAPAARAASAVAEELAPLAGKAPTSEHVARLVAFVRAHERPVSGDDETRARHLRARGAVLTILQDLRAAALVHDDPAVTGAELAASVRRWIQSQTFAPVRGHGGIRLIDAQSAHYADVENVHLAGLVAGDWPEPAPRNIFYPPFLLARLGWPPDTERIAAERAAFADLLHLARQQVSVSSFALEDDGIVEPSPLLEDLERAGLPVRPAPETGPVRIFDDEAVSGAAAGLEALTPGPGAWHALRASRTPPVDPAFHGCAPPPGKRAVAPATRPYTVTGLDRYLECPFKYFAANVLKLPEETPDEQGLSPKERGRFVHEVFRAFFAEWQARGGRGIGVEQLDEARALFADVSEQCLGTLPATEASLERLRLLGSVAAPGLADIVLAAEAERESPVSERLLEFGFEGDVELKAGGTTRTVRLRGKADRIDVLADGRLRIIDYKIGRPPDDSIQLPLYAVCLAQQFAREGRPVAGTEAFYVAFGDRRNPVQSVVGDGARLTGVLEDAQRRALEAIDGIERGQFPPRPAAPRLCATCPHAAVCRKDYVSAD